MDVPHQDARTASNNDTGKYNMALLDIATIGFACWTLAYHMVLLARVPAYLLYPAFVVLAVAALLILTDKRWKPTPAIPAGGGEDRPYLAGVIVLSTASSVLSTVVSWPNWDDLGFFHRALVQYDSMGLPIIVKDTMHNVTGMPPSFMLTLETSYEMLSAFAAKIAGMDPLVFYHNVSPAAVALLVPMAYFALSRRLGLSSRNAFFATVGAVVFLWLDGGPHFSFGNMGFVRMYQGKAVFMTLAIPVILLYMLRYTDSQNRGNWTMLALAGICGAGLTSSALFMTPVLLLAFSASIAANRKAEIGHTTAGTFAEFLALNLAGLYCIVLLLLLLLPFSDAIPRENIYGRQAETWWDSVQLVLGDGWKMVWAWLTLFAAPFLALDKNRARLLVVYAAALIFLCFNPATGPVLSDRIFVYSRLAYLLPLPLCAGLSLVAFSSLFERNGSRTYWHLRNAIVAALAVTAVLGNGVPTFAEANRAFFKSPAGYKFDRPELNFAREVSEELDERSLLAPVGMAVTLALMNYTVRLETSRPFYTVAVFKGARNKGEADRRIKAQDFVEDVPAGPEELAAFETSISGGVDAVVACNAKLKPVLNSLTALPGKWEARYTDENFTLFLKSRTQ